MELVQSLNCNRSEGKGKSQWSSYAQRLLKGTESDLRFDRIWISVHSDWNLRHGWREGGSGKLLGVISDA